RDNESAASSPYYIPAFHNVKSDRRWQSLRQGAGSIAAACADLAAGPWCPDRLTLRNAGSGEQPLCLSEPARPDWREKTRSDFVVQRHSHQVRDTGRLHL